MVMGMELSDGSRIGVIGGGPAGSLTSYFLLDIAERIDLQLQVDIYEPRDFSRTGPAGCNMCGGVVSESLVQLLAIEGINLPPSVVQRGIESYVLHTDGENVHIRTPREEMRIAALHRGNGPKGRKTGKWKSLDGFLLNLVCEKGANHITDRVKGIRLGNGKPSVYTKEMREQVFDLVIGAVGVNSRGLDLFERLGTDIRGPRTTRAYIAEIPIGREKVREYLGDSIHAFLLNIPRLKFAALIPKDEYVTVCLLGDQIDQALAESFMNSAEVRGCLPTDADLKLAACKCLPRINFGSPAGIFVDRVVMVGDCGVSRLYKDGIGAAYRAAKACALTAIVHGVSQEDFRKHYWPLCRRMAWDNKLGKTMFMSTTVIKKIGFFRLATLRMIRREQTSGAKSRTMSMVIWDLFTGSAPYRDVFFRCLHPGFILSFGFECAKAVLQTAVRHVGSFLIPDRRD